MSSAELVKQQISPIDWQATPASIQYLFSIQVEQLKILQATQIELLNRIAELEEQLGKHSGNSSQSSSKDKPGEKPSTQRPQRKPRGFKPLAIRRQRPLYRPESCQSIHDEKPSHCQDCGEPLTGEDSTAHRHQIVDIPPIVPVITEYRLHTLACAHCGTTTQASLPIGVSGRCYGSTVAGLIGLLSGPYRQSHRQVAALLKEVFGISLSRGSINRARQEVSQAIDESVRHAHAYVVRQPALNCDETGFEQGNQDGLNPNESQGWLWVLLSPLVIVFSVTLSRSQAAAKTLLSETFSGIVGTDRYSSYNWIDPKQRQVCWAHLLRDFTAIAERTGVSREIGEALLVRGYRLFHWWHRVRDGTLSEQDFQQAMSQLRAGMVAELKAAAALPIARKEKSPLARTVRTCAKILTVEPALWTFVDTPGVEPTNNAAEQALRPAVIWKYTSFGSQSQAGSEFVARILTVNATLKAQNRSVLEFLSQSVQALRSGSDSPSLLPMVKEKTIQKRATLLIAS